MTFKVISATFAAIVLTLGPARARRSNPSAGVVHELFRQPLPENPGMDMVVITVLYPPGGATPPHEHPGFAYRVF
ncbi:MAG: hypothetical protein ACLQU2_11800 [Candidatus Binataceae bacterium]